MHAKPKTNCADLSCLFFSQTLGFANLVKRNTFLRNKEDATSMLDLVLSDSSHLVANISLKNAVGASSHCRIAVVLNIKPNRHKTYIRACWKYHCADWVAMCEHLASCDWGKTHQVEQ